MSRVLERENGLDDDCQCKVRESGSVEKRLLTLIDRHCLGDCEVIQSSDGRK